MKSFVPSLKGMILCFSAHTSLYTVVHNFAVFVISEAEAVVGPNPFSKRRSRELQIVQTMHHPPEAALIHANIEGDSYRMAGRSVVESTPLAGAARATTLESMVQEWT